MDAERLEERVHEGTALPSEGMAADSSTWCCGAAWEDLGAQAQLRSAPYPKIVLKAGQRRTRASSMSA